MSIQDLLAILILAPFAVACLLAVFKNDTVRAAIVYVCGLAIAILAITTAALWFMKGETLQFNFPYMEIIDKVILVGDFVLMFLVIILAIKARKTIISLLSIVQTVLVAGIEMFGPEVEIETSIRVDWLTVIMILIIGVIGIAIGIYAIGYMRGYHVHHSEFKDRRSFFFAIMFVFYGAMFGLVSSMNLIWIYFFWEITSVCSFLLIGYTRTEEAVNNSFRALWMNLLGGLGIAIAIAYAIYMEDTINLYEIINQGAAGLLIPIAMLAFASLTKSAQFPFSSWLLGAMVAPTPSSALLHSATMVKAGVYMLIRISPAMVNNQVGEMVFMVGGFTFFVASLLAIAQSDGKKILAYSTVSNLGLIVACAGVGYQQTIWAAAFLVIFHAVSKSMLFQCVGAIENSTGSRDVETMQGLAVRYPKLAFILIIGIAGMFLAPFGMLISKWAALSAFVDAKSVVMVLFIVYGSATTMFYWTKWMAKILGINGEKGKDVTQKNEYFSMFLHAILVIALCVTYPFISRYVIEPMLMEMYGNADPVLSYDNFVIMIIMVVAVFVVPMVNFISSKMFKQTEALAYMGGANAGDNEHFVDSMGESKELKIASWYMEDWFGEKKLLRPATLLAILYVVVMICIIVGGAI